MIPKRIQSKAYRLKRQQKSRSCHIEHDGRFYWVHLDLESIKLGRAKRAQQA
jgi:hypothetical protein